MKAVCFQGADLSEANLEGADLSKARLIEANLSKANLSEANLEGADLSKANLSEANLVWANLIGAKGLTVDQLLEVKTLYEAELSKYIRKQLEDEYPDRYLELTKEPDYYS